MVSFQKAFWSKIAVAGHGTRYLFRLTFSRIISIFAILLSQCLFAKRIEKKNSHNSDDSLPINCLSSANQQCVQPASVTVFFKFSKLSVNPSWVKWCIFKTSQRSHSLERAQEVKFFPQWSSEGQKSVMSMSSDICNFCTCDRMSEIFWHPVTAASRAPRFPTKWPRNDGLWGREWALLE